MDHCELDVSGAGGEIKVGPVRLDTSSPDLSIGYVEGTSLTPGQELRIQVVYSSDHDEPDQGDLVIGLNVAATQELRIPISTPGQRALLVASPSALDFGITQAGSPGTISMVLYNAGTAPATLKGYEVVGDVDGDFSATIPEGAVVQPGATVLASAHYAPTNQNKDEGVLRILTDREDVSTEVPMEGEEEIFLVFPHGMCPDGFRGKLQAALYGTRRASFLWGEKVATVFASEGFNRSKVCGQVFWHPEKRLRCSVYGDDLTTVGPKSSLDWMRAELEKHYEFIEAHRLGPGPEDDKEA